MKNPDVLAELAAQIAAAGSQTKFAKLKGFSQSYIADVVATKRPPSERLLAALGFARAIVRTK